MGVFGDWAQNYYDSGFSVLPVHPKKKACFIEGWTNKFSFKFPSEKDQEHYVDKYADHSIGLATGESSGIVAIDFDYVDMADSQAIEDLIIGSLPYTPCIKKGAKGWTRFYRFDGEVKNLGIDRFGVRMVDILSTGRLTVIPPSLHSNDGTIYKWIGEFALLDIDANEIPLVTSEHIDQMVETSKYDNSIFEECGIAKTSRHDLIVGFILRASDKATDIEDLIHKVQQFDVEINAREKKGPYLHDKRYLKDKSSYEFTKDFCMRVCGWKQRKKQSQGINWDIGKYPSLHAQGKKASTNFEDFRSFFKFNYPTARFDRLRRTTFVQDTRLNRWEPIDNIREVIESKASEAGLSPNYVNRHLQRWASTLEPRLVVDIKRWDGKDHVGDMCKSLSIQNVDQSVALSLFKEWGANVFRRLNDKRRMEQNAMIILKGDQGIGKDTFINHLFRALGPYFSEIELQERKIENYQTISDLLVANIPEFDETHKVGLATLKSLITSPGATFRAAYARKSEFVPFCVSYISSCNFDHILRDASGNRRFWIFELDSIDWSYASVDPEQILAQWHHLYKTNYRSDKEALKSMKEYIKKETPDSVDDLIVQECDSIIYSLTPLNNDPVGWVKLAPEVDKLARRYRVSIRRVQSVMKKYDLSFRTREGIFYKSSKLKTQSSMLPK